MGMGTLREGAIQDAISKRVELSQKSILNGSTYLPRGGKRPTGTSYLFPSLSTLPSLSRLSSRPSLSLSKLTSLALFRLTSLALLLPSCPPHPDRLDEELAPVLIRTLLSLSSSS